MSSRREDLIRILALLQRKTSIEKKSHIKMLKMALFDCASNKKRLQFWWRTVHLPSFFVPTPGGLTAQESPPPGIFHPRQKKMMLMPGGQPGGEEAGRRWNFRWNWLMHKWFWTVFSLGDPGFCETFKIAHCRTCVLQLRRNDLKCSFYRQNPAYCSRLYLLILHK